MKRLLAVVLVIGVTMLALVAGPADASNPSCAAQFVTQFAGPGFGQAVSAEAMSEGASFGAETKSFGTAPHDACPVISG
jgi:hypothetical protein